MNSSKESEVHDFLIYRSLKDQAPWFLDGIRKTLRGLQNKIIVEYHPTTCLIPDILKDTSNSYIGIVTNPLIKTYLEKKNPGARYATEYKGCCDVVLTQNSLQYEKDFASTLRSIYQLLSINGLFILWESDFTSLKLPGLQENVMYNILKFLSAPILQPNIGKLLEPELTKMGMKAISMSRDIQLNPEETDYKFIQSKIDEYITSRSCNSDFENYKTCIKQNQPITFTRYLVIGEKFEG